MIDARQLRYFTAVVEELHFAKAADRLNVAQSALSAQIQRLEQEIGVRLLNRNKRQPVTLTDAGRLFHAEAVAALRHIDRADQVGRLAARGLAGIVRIGFVASATSSGVLSDMLRRFRPSHANVRIDVVAMETPKQFDALIGGDIDVGIVRPRRRYPPDITVTIVHTERLMVAMAESHPLASRRHLSARDLRDQPFISPQFDEDEGFGEVLTALGDAGGFPALLDYRVQDFISAVSLASAGYGIVIVPESFRHFSLPGVCYRYLNDFQFTVHLALASRRRELSPAVRAFLSEAGQHAAST
ncbi:LysR family transcriptional regulator [Burkholderia pseudomultivorans]|uniref:LysR family transcriptional regulator n=1 Tax=Burkholderia pseudomultivorans TaxID=1207504 RepID=UPI0028759C0D|nr:LysR family transcriptional regulator [Burkholderia pseudomultivorans]MDS0858222.1 LysR family transcriptional regulator [Burkholderia pseudomultivorans]